MKTNEVKACVTRQLRRLQVLPEPQRRAELAELRRGVGRQPGDLPALWGALLAEKTSAGQDWTESSVLRRFNALATADSIPEVSHHLRGMIQLLRREGIPLDYPQLAEDLYQYQFVDGAPNVRLRWGRDLYASPTEKTKENEKEN